MLSLPRVKTATVTSVLMSHHNMEHVTQLLIWQDNVMMNLLQPTHPRSHKPMLSLPHVKAGAVT